MKVRRERALDATAEEIWRVAGDPYHLPRWWPRAQRVEGVTADAWTVVLGSDRGRAVRADYRLLDEEPGRRRVWELELEGSPFERIFREQITTLEVGEGSARIVVDQKGRRFARMGGWMLRGATGRLLDEALEALASVLAPGRPRDPSSTRERRDGARR